MGAIQTRHHLLRWGKGGYMKRPPVFLQNGGSCLSTIVLTISLILKYFHIQTSAIKRKYPTLIVRIFLVSACTHSISRYIHIQTLCVHKRNVLRFLQHGTYHVVVRGGSHFCQSPKGGESGVFFKLKCKGGPTFFLGKNNKIPQPSPPKKKRTFPNHLKL